MKYNIEPTPFKQHSNTVTPWKQDTCGCGKASWLRFDIVTGLFLCLQCSHERRVADWERLEWLWCNFA